MRIYPKSLKQEAAQKLDRLSCRPRKIVLIYAAVAFGVALVAALMNLFLNSQVAQTGGLDGLEVKTLWETTATVSELALAFLTPIWSLGLISVALMFARSKDAQPKDLTAGFNRFLPGLGLYLLTALLYVLAALIAVYIGTALVGGMADMDKLDAILAPVIQAYEENPDVLPTLPWLEILSCLWLPLVLLLLITIVFVAFISYRLRLSCYYLMDGLGMGPAQAMRKSFSSMKGNVLSFIRLDLSYWWYYALMALFGTGSLATLVPFLLGVPQVSDLAAVGIQFLSSGALCALYWWKGAQVETTFALAYENLKVKTL